MSGRHDRVRGARDEAGHEPDGDDPLWGEAWSIEWAGGARSASAGLCQLLLWPHRRVAWWWTYVMLPDGVLVVRDHEVPSPRQGLEIRADGLWAELVCEIPFEHWSIGMEAFGIVLDDEAASLGAERGERVGCGLDLEWEVGPARSPASSAEDWPGEHWPGEYRIDGRVIGVVPLTDGRSSIDVDTFGVLGHRWGRIDPMPPSWPVTSTEAGPELARVAIPYHGIQRSRCWHGSRSAGEAIGSWRTER